MDQKEYLKKSAFERQKEEAQRYIVQQQEKAMIQAIGGGPMPLCSRCSGLNIHRANKPCKRSSQGEEGSLNDMDIEKEADYLAVSLTFLTGTALDEVKPKILAFGQRCADEALEKAAVKLKQWGSSYADRVRSLKSSK